MNDYMMSPYYSTVVYSPPISTSDVASATLFWIVIYTGVFLCTVACITLGWWYSPTTTGARIYPSSVVKLVQYLPVLAGLELGAACIGTVMGAGIGFVIGVLVSVCHTVFIGAVDSPTANNGTT